MDTTTTAREFPDYPVASLPTMPSHWVDRSWHNDACPSYAPDEDSVIRVLIDYPEDDQREIPGEGRYHVIVEAGAAGYDLVSTDDWDEALAWVVAWGLCQCMSCLLGPETMNLLARTPSIGPNDVCDANALMLKFLYGPAAHDEATDIDQFREARERAWQIAREHRYFTDP